MWNEKFTWIIYKQECDLVYCSICRDAFQRGLITCCHDIASKRTHDAFVTNGFNTWKRAIESFRNHEQSALHREASLKISSTDKDVNVLTHLSDIKQKQMDESRNALLIVLSAIRFLLHQGLAIRGHEDTNSNFIQLLQLLAHNLNELQWWVQRDTFRWLSHDITNEMMEIMSHEVYRKIMQKFLVCKYYAIIIDETTDCATTEQVSFCIRTVSDELTVEEDFVGFYETSLTDAETLFSVAKDVLVRLQLPITFCKEQAYNGAANM